jgi:polyisoprenoid-binding protein YceI
MLKPFLIFSACAMSVFGQSYQIDSAHSGASFSVKHMMVTNVSGRFSNVQGKVNFDEKNLAKSSIEASVDVTTINTNEPKRDGHLKSPDFFDVAKYPTISFASTKVYKEGGTTKVDGNLTLHGVTKPVTLTLDELSGEVKSPMGTIVRGTVARTKISRKDFGLTWNKTIETGGVVVGDEIAVTLEIELSRKAS